MFRVIGVALLCVVLSGIASAQQSRKPNDGGRDARPGESCLKFHSDCGQWCEANQSGANQAACKTQCNGSQTTCLQTGVWRTPLTPIDVRGLPAK